MDTMKALIFWALSILVFIIAVQYWVYTRDMDQKQKAMLYQAYYKCVVTNYGHVPLSEEYPLCP